MRVCDITKADDVVAHVRLQITDPANNAQSEPLIELDLGKRALDALRKQEFYNLGQLVPRKDRGLPVGGRGNRRPGPRTKAEKAEMEAQAKIAAASGGPGLEQPAQADQEQVAHERAIEKTPERVEAEQQYVGNPDDLDEADDLNEPF